MEEQSVLAEQSDRDEARRRPAMPEHNEHNGPGLIILGILRGLPPNQVLVVAGDNTDIEHTRQRARSLVAGGSHSACLNVWIVTTIFDATPSNGELTEPQASGPPCPSD